MVTVRILLIARPNKQVELLQALNHLRKKIASEPGCSSCWIYQNMDDRNQFVVFEEWENRNRAQQHLDSQNLAILVGAGSVLTKKVSVSLSKDAVIENLEESFMKLTQREHFFQSDV